MQLRFHSPHPKRLLILALLLLLPLPVQAQKATSTERLVILGVDGVTFKVLTPLVEAGRLPNIERLLKTGTSAVLVSEKPMRSPALWSTIATGQPRDVHGIYDFVTGSYYWPKDQRKTGRRLVTSTMLKAPPLWSYATHGNLESLVVGWLNTWPALALKGNMVAPFVALGDKKQTSIKGKIYKDESRQTYPKQLFKDISPLIHSAEDIPAARIRQLANVPPKNSPLFKKIPKLKRYLYTIRWSIASALTNTAILEDLLKKNPETALVMSYFDGSDTLAHRFWLMRQPLHEIKARLKGHDLDPRLARELKARFSNVLDGYYELLDELVGRIQEAAGPNSTIVLISDHGWATQKRNRTIHPTVPFDGQHELDGILIASGPKIKHGTLAKASIYDIAPTALYLLNQGVPSELPGRILLGMINDDYKKGHPPVALITPANSGKAGKATTEPTRVHFEEKEFERLKSLGYIQ